MIIITIIISHRTTLWDQCTSFRKSHIHSSICGLLK